jgi:hypothetical protein
VLRSIAQLLNCSMQAIGIAMNIDSRTSAKDKPGHAEHAGPGHEKTGEEGRCAMVPAR